MAPWRSTGSLRSGRSTRPPATSSSASSEKTNVPSSSPSRTSSSRRLSASEPGPGSSATRVSGLRAAQPRFLQGAVQRLGGEVPVNRAARAEAPSAPPLWPTGGQPPHRLPTWLLRPREGGVVRWGNQTEDALSPRSRALVDLKAAKLFALERQH